VHQALAVPVPGAALNDDAVRRAQAGDAGAFETLYHAHAGRVYALCLRMSGDAVAARELLQDVFVRAWEKLDTFRGDSAIGTWLHRLTVNVILMKWRAEGRRGEQGLDDGENGGAMGTQVATREAPAGLRLDLETAIAALPPGARQVLVLHDIEGYEHKEIGRLMGIAEGTSKAHLFRARRMLREALDR
jgi:RNA polymerase sigma-70 factor (ECF subfamily)